MFSHDHADSNYNADESEVTRWNARFLRRAWETFNDDALVPGPPPTGFVLEGALGLVYPNTVVGVVASPIAQDQTVYYVDELGTVFSRDAATGSVLDPVQHWTTTLADPDFANGAPPLAPELFYTSPIVTDDYIWLVGSFYSWLHLVERAGETGQPDAAFPTFVASPRFRGSRTLRNVVEDLAPNRMVNGEELNEPNPTHTPRMGRARIRLN